MKSGLMDTLITVEAPTASIDATGGEVVTWATVATPWARRLSQKGREFYAGSTLVGSADAGFQFRIQSALANMDQRWRIVHQGVIWNIASIDRAIRAEHYTVLCSSGANRG